MAPLLTGGTTSAEAAHASSGSFSVSALTQVAPGVEPLVEKADPRRAFEGDEAACRLQTPRASSAIGRLFSREAKAPGDVLRPLHPLAPVANRAAQVGVAAADVARPILVVRHDEVRDLDGNSRAVQHDGKDRDAAAHGRLEIEAVMSN